eukprot:COSAG06_NODE_59464_length_274_cov_0.588571_1_plen_42_part_10
MSDRKHSLCLRLAPWLLTGRAVTHTMTCSTVIEEQEREFPEQ